MTIEAIAARTRNASGVSVGTSLAMETLLPGWPVFDRERIAPPPVDLGSYQRVWMNVRTLFRNLYNSIDRDQRQGLQASDLAEALVEEMETIHQAIREGSAGAVTCTFYEVDYSRVSRIFPKAKVREPSTDIARAQEKMIEKVLYIARSNITTNHKGWWIQTGPRIDPGSYQKTIMLTHIGLDLLNHYRFGTLVLLESHTGHIKGRNLWYTKFLNGKGYSTIPFCEAMLQVFGDDHIFHPKHIAVKRALLEISQQNNWSFMTSNSKMRSDIARHPDQLFVKEMKEFFVTL